MKGWVSSCVLAKCCLHYSANRNSKAHVRQHETLLLLVVLHASCILESMEQRCVYCIVLTVYPVLFTVYRVQSARPHDVIT